jgi:hypothetical protein
MRTQPADRANARTAEVRREPSEPRRSHENAAPTARPERPRRETAPDQAPTGKKVRHPVACVRRAVERRFRCDSDGHAGGPEQQLQAARETASGRAQRAKHPKAPASRGSRARPRPGPAGHTPKHPDSRSTPPAADWASRRAAPRSRIRRHPVAGHPAARRPAAAAQRRQTRQRPRRRSRPLRSPPLPTMQMPIPETVRGRRR